MLTSISDVILTLHGVSSQIGDKVIIENANLGIHSEDKIGLIGVNGSGKTTLLRLVTKENEPTSGTITTRNHLKIGYLPQNPVFDPDAKVLDHVFPPDHIILDEEVYKYKSILTQLGLTDFGKRIDELSGGQKRKVDIARVLALKPDLYVLDEPTNHLDLDSIEWLQDYLSDSKQAVIFVTHDRYFLDAVANKILEIENSSLFFYPGSYSEYLKGKMQREVDAQRKETRRKAQLSKELQWLSRGAQARASKPKNHIDRVKELLSKSYLISNTDLDISFQTDRLGKTILELHKLSKSYNNIQLFRNVDHVFQANERVGIVGDNGCGKTTLLRIISGEEEPDMGAIKVGVNTHFSYYKQEDDTFDPKLSVYDYIAQYAEVIKTRDGTKFTATEMLKRFLFDHKMQLMKLGSLSGGERKRLYLLKSLMFGANFIVLDEPTNDLDIRTLEVLEDYLDAFQGCLLVVSHDRYFLDRTIDYLFIFEDGEIRKFAGNYSDYLLVKKYEREKSEELKKSKIIRPKKVRNGLSYNEQQELLSIEKEISELEAQIINVEELMNDSKANHTYEQYSVLAKNYEGLNSRYELLFTRWSELMLIVESKT